MNREHRIRLYISLAIGACADGYLRIRYGDEGNLLIHTVVFLVSGGISYVTMKAFSRYFS